MTNDTVDTNATTMLTEETVWTTGPDGEQIPNYEATFPTINEGEVVHGKVVRVDKDEVLVDIGYKSEGVIPVAELSIRRSVNPEDEVKLGDEVDALVLTKEDADGRLILSKKRARFEIAWKAIESAAESGEAVNGKVIEVVKGGLILDLGVRGFLPASLVDIRRVQDLDEFLGQELRCKVIELNRSRNNVVLSRRAVLEDERKEMRQAILDRLSPGDVVEGQISNIVDFGAFVDLDGMIVADVIRAAALATIPVAWWLGALTMSQLVAVAFTVGALTVVFDLSNASFFVALVDRSQYVDANSKFSTTRSLSYIAGPSSAGLLVQALTAPVAIAADAVSFVVSALALRGVKVPEPKVEPTESSAREDLKEGFQYLAHEPVLRAGVACGRS